MVSPTIIIIRITCLKVGEAIKTKFLGGSSNRQSSFQQQSLYPSIQERLSKFEDTFEKFMQASLANQKNNKATITNLETQVRHIAKQLAKQQSD